MVLGFGSETDEHKNGKCGNKRGTHDCLRRLQKAHASHDGLYNTSHNG
jgi:hypothetical protein